MEYNSVAKEAQAWVVCLVENVKLQVDLLNYITLNYINPMLAFEVRRMIPTTACSLMMKSTPMNKLFILFRKLSTAHRRKLLVLQRQ